MFPRYFPGCLALTIAAALCAVAPARSQGLVDGFSFGAGLSMYGGDLDGNPNSDLPSYVGSGRLLVYAGFDKQIGKARAGIEVSFSQLRGTSTLVDGTHSVIASDVILSYNVFGPISLYAGAGPAMILPSYARTTPNAVLDGWAVEGPHVAVTFPVGVVLQEHVKIGLRLTPSDLLDGYRGGGNGDIMGQFSVGYRIRL